MPYYHAYYEFFTEEQFAADEFFQQWVISEDRRNNHFWKSYLDKYPAQFDAVLNARRLVKEIAGQKFATSPLTEDERAELRKSIYRQLNMREEAAVQMPIRRRLPLAWLAAATVVGLAISGYFLFPRHQPAEEKLVLKTGNKEIKEVLLPDSSTVVLNANSTLKLAPSFSGNTDRLVYLEGNAYFKVRKTPRHTPFIVKADQLSILVTGTEFNVNARSKATDIVLTSGHVNVTLNNNSRKTAAMNPGERLQLDTIKKEFVSSRVNTEIYTTAWKDKEWHFQETRLDSIAEMIREYYGMEMVFASDRQRRMMITAVVSVKDFSTLINVIAKTLNIKIKEERNQLLIF